jgi:hypothetical protein
MLEARYSGLAATLPDGRIVLTGGVASRGGPLASTELYGPDPAP